MFSKQTILTTQYSGILSTLQADNTQMLSRKLGYSNCYGNEMLTHTICEIKWHCADYTFSLVIVCTLATNQTKSSTFVAFAYNTDLVHINMTRIFHSKVKILEVGVVKNIIFSTWYI